MANVFETFVNLCRYAIMTECWDEQPKKRPTFRWLCSAVRRLLDDHKVCKGLRQYITLIRNVHSLFIIFVAFVQNVYKPRRWGSEGREVKKKHIYKEQSRARYSRPNFMMKYCCVVIFTYGSNGLPNHQQHT